SCKWGKGMIRMRLKHVRRAAPAWPKRRPSRLVLTSVWAAVLALGMGGGTAAAVVHAASASASTSDTDHDGIANNSDDCVTVANPSQVDTDHDGHVNPCDKDHDSDRRHDDRDNCTTVYNHAQ